MIFVLPFAQAFTGEPPFPRLPEAAISITVAMHNKRSPRPLNGALELGLDDTVWALIENCWKTHPADRPDVHAVHKEISAVHAAQSSTPVPTTARQ
jgi:hypothetical protein